MTESDYILLSLIRIGISSITECCKLEDLTISQWQSVIDNAFRHGVPAIAADGYELLLKANPEIKNKLALGCPEIKKLKFKWLSSVTRIENANSTYFSIVKQFADYCKESDVRVVVLKGLSCARYYPVPNHRPTGDFDCFLCGHYELGNTLAREAGAQVVDRHYKHSEIFYNGIQIENHRYCTAFRGDKRKKRLEIHLQSLLKEPSGNYVKGTSLELPCADFNALFLTSHAFFHFLAEGLNLRQLVDWALFLKHEQSNVDWKSFYEWTDFLHLTNFVNAMNTLAVKHLGIDICTSEIIANSNYADKLMEDILSINANLYKTSSTGKIRMGFIKNQFKSVWKYHKIYRKSMVLELFKMMFSLLFENVEDLETLCNERNKDRD